jgi:hypothetical protein
MEDEEQNTFAMIQDEMDPQTLLELGSRMLAEKERLELMYVVKPDESASAEERVQAGTSFSLSVRWEAQC